MNTTSSSQQNHQARLVQLDANGNIQWISPNANPIQLYGSELLETIRQKETLTTYKQALIRTWRILKYFLLLLLFIFLFGVALLISFWAYGYNLGYEFQLWMDNGSKEETFLQKLQTILLFPIRKIVEWSNRFLKRYVPDFEPSDLKVIESTDENQS